MYQFIPRNKKVLKSTEENLTRKRDEEFYIWIDMMVF